MEMKIVLVLVLLIATIVVGGEGREIKSKPETTDQPQTYFPGAGNGGFFGNPGLGGGSGQLGPGFGLGQPLFGSIPNIGGSIPNIGSGFPGLPGGGVGNDQP